MPLDMQPHLLRVLQDGIVVRLGDTRDRRVSMRLIAATNRDLQKEVAQGRFREDLYHRLCVLSLPLPALRDRPGDIETIVEHLNRKLADKYGCAPKQLEASVLQAFHNYRWPGNIRELQNVFESTFALSEGPVIELAALPPAIAQALAPSNNGPAPDLSGGATGRLEDVEHKAILDAVGQSQGNMTAAARTLGISRSTLYVKLAAIRAHAGL
jgi:DNA-binding NtrC family response regulator